MITVATLCRDYLEPNDCCVLDSINSGKTVWQGTIREAMKSDYSNKVVQSFSSINDGICINIDVEEEE